MSHYEIIEADYEQYKRLINADVLNFPGSVFYHPDFLQVSSEVLKLHFSPLICLESGKVVGLMNLLLGRRFMFRTALIPKLFQYYGPYSLTGNPEVCSRLISFIERHSDTAVLSLLPGCVEPFPGWRIKKRIAHVLVPNAFDYLRSHCTPDIKNKVNKAVKVGVEAKRAPAFNYDLYNASFARQDTKPPIERNDLIKWVARLAELNLAETYIACIEDKPVAIRVLLVYHGYAYTWLSGILSDFRSLGANSILILKIGDILYNRGIKTWDFGGGDIQSIGHFKKAFGTTPMEHLEIEKNFNWQGAFYRALMKLKGRFNG